MISDGIKKIEKNPWFNSESWNDEIMPNLNLNISKEDFHSINIEVTTESKSHGDNEENKESWWWPMSHWNRRVELYLGVSIQLWSSSLWPALLHRRKLKGHSKSMRKCDCKSNVYDCYYNIYFSLKDCYYILDTCPKKVTQGCGMWRMYKADIAMIRN